MWAIVNREKDYTSGAGIKIDGASGFLCETVDDVLNGPNSLAEAVKKDKSIGVGSTATIISTGEVYILGPSKTWIKYGGVSIKG